MASGQKPSIKFKVDDNSGAKIAEFIGFPGNSKIVRQLEVGDIIRITVKRALSNNAIKSGQIFSAIITRLCRWTVRSDGSQVQANENGIVLLDNKCENMIGTRVLSIVSREAAQLYPAIGALAIGLY